MTDDPNHVLVNVADLIPGDFVDLRSCPFLRDDPSAEFEYATVYGWPSRDSQSTVSVPFEDHGVIAYDQSQQLLIHRRDSPLFSSYHFPKWAEAFPKEDQ